MPALEEERATYLFAEGFDLVLGDGLVVIELFYLAIEDGDLVHGQKRTHF